MKKNLDAYILTREELRIMKIIWKRGSATVREVFEAVSKNKNAAYTTILTFIKILEEKGALTRKKAGRAYRYTPVLTRRQATRNQINDLLLRFFEGNPNKLIQMVLENEDEVTRPMEPLLASAALRYELKRAVSPGNAG